MKVESRDVPVNQFEMHLQHHVWRQTLYSFNSPNDYTDWIML